MEILQRLVRERTLSGDRIYWAVTYASLAIVLFVLGVGAYLGMQAASLFSPEAGDAAARLQGVVETTPAWLVPLGLLGLSGLMVAVAVVLRRIIKTIELRRDAMVTYFPTLVKGGE